MAFLKGLRGARGNRPAGRAVLNRASPQASLASGIPVSTPLTDWFGVPLTQTAITPQFVTIPGYGLALTGGSGGSGLIVSAGPVGDYGTGDFGAAVWVRTNASALQVAASEYGGGVGAGTWWLGSGASAAGLPAFALPSSNVYGTTRVDDGQPHLLAGFRINGVASIYMDGRLEGSIAATDVVNTNVRLRIGDGFGPGVGFGWSGEVWHAWTTRRPIAGAWALYDALTRWDLYAVPSTRVVFDMGAAAAAASIRKQYIVRQSVNRSATF